MTVTLRSRKDTGVLGRESVTGTLHSIRCVNSVLSKTKSPQLKRYIISFRCPVAVHTVRTTLCLYAHLVIQRLLHRMVTDGLRSIAGRGGLNLRDLW